MQSITSLIDMPVISSLGHRLTVAEDNRNALNRKRIVPLVKHIATVSHCPEAVCSM